MFIDADTHVDECEDTWSYFPVSMKEFKPVPMVFENEEQPGYVRGRHHRGLFIDGQVYRVNFVAMKSQERLWVLEKLTDIPGRLKQMDELGVDVQVIYPTLLLFEVTRRPELEVAICESYNRWLGDRCLESNGRLRWAAVLPLRSMPEAFREMRRAKEAGAVAIFKRGFETDDRHASDPYFAPMYALAEELDLPICVHVSSPYSGNANLLTKLQKGLLSTFYVQDAFFSLVQDGFSEKYPGLRFGFIEAAAGWVPHMLWLAGFDKVVTSKRKDPDFRSTRTQMEQILIDSRIFVTCEVSEDIPALIDQLGDSTLMVGSDYCHNDRASVQNAQQVISDRVDISSESAERLTYDNAKRLYAIH